MDYKIKEVVRKIGISAHTIRYYEKEGIIPHITRNASGIRQFTDADIYWLELVTCFKNTNMPVADIKKIVELSQIGDSTIEERKEILEKHKSKIEDAMKALEKAKAKVQSKIDFYNGSADC